MTRRTALYRRPNTSKPAPGHKVYPYLLRNLAVTRPNQVWAMDITYVPMIGNPGRRRGYRGLGHRLGKRVVAEGVEAPSQLEYPGAVGCDGAQGLLLCEPISATDLVPLLEGKPLTDRVAAGGGWPEGAIASL